MRTSELLERDRPSQGAYVSTLRYASLAPLLVLVVKLHTLLLDISDFVVGLNFSITFLNSAV